MTVKKSLKRRVRARMTKTGERYTVARRQVIAKAGQADPEPTIPTELAPPADATAPSDEATSAEPAVRAVPTVPTEPAALPESVTPNVSAESADAVESASVPPETAAAAMPANGEPESLVAGPASMPPAAAVVDSAANGQTSQVKLDVSDDALRRRTGRGWDEWFALLDAWGATERKHPEIARWLNEAHHVDGWWAQSVTVGYERARGLRAVHELTDGFAASASKTVAVPVERLYEAFADEALRARWLPATPLTIRSGRPGKSLHATLATS